MKNKPLYLVTDNHLSLPRSVEEVVRLAAEGGVDWVQLREKSLETHAFIQKAKAIKKILAPFQIPLIINDRVDVALTINAEGVHIGQQDMPYPMARKLLGKDKIIGLSVENMQQLLQAQNWDLDYIALSPVFATATKTDTAEPWGIEGIREAKKISRHPLVAIGGIKIENIEILFEAGIDSAAVVSAICAAPDPKKATEKLKSLIHEVMLQLPSS